MNQHVSHRSSSLASLIVITIIFLAFATFGSIAQAASLPLSAEDGCIQLTKELRFGKRDSTTNGEVTMLQDFLIDFEYLTGEPTGRFGTKTRSALRAFQEDEGIRKTGITDVQTRNAIFNLSCNSDDSNNGDETDSTSSGTNTVNKLTATDCIILENGNSCDIELSWNGVPNPTATSSGLVKIWNTNGSDNPNSWGGVYTQENSGTKKVRIYFGKATFALAIGGSVVVKTDATATCEMGTSMNQNLQKCTKESAQANLESNTIIEGKGPIRCTGGDVTWLDDSTITIMSSGSPKLLSCTATLPNGSEDGSVKVYAKNGGKSSGVYWMNGYGEATFNCIKENGEYKWKTGAGKKMCSSTFVSSNTQSGVVETQSVTTNSSTNTQASCEVPNTNLELGDGVENNKATQVIILQRFLISKGFLVYAPGPTGYFGSLTMSALKSFQAANGMPQTGTVTEATRAKIQSLCTSGNASTANTGLNNSSTQIPAISNFSLSPTLVAYNGSVKFSWTSINTLASDQMSIVCKSTKNGVTATTTRMGDTIPLKTSDERSIPLGEHMIGDHSCVAQLIRNKLPIGAPVTKSYKVQQQLNITNNCLTGTVLGLIGGVPYCLPATGTTCPSGTTLGYVNSTAVCNTTSSVNTNNTHSTGGVAATTGYSCYEDNLYYNGKLQTVCPKAPNGGIACDAHWRSDGCAGEGKVWINGKTVTWKGNSSGACYADSACELGHECRSQSGAGEKRCTPKTEWSTDFGVTGPQNSTGALYKRTWSGVTWGAWQFEKCVPGYHQVASNQCESDLRNCTTTQNIAGTQTYLSSGTWSTCQPKTDSYGVPICPAGQYYNGAQGCVSATRSCTAWNGYPTTYPRGTDVATAQQRYDRVTGWGLCEITCKDEYTKETVYSSTLGVDAFQIAPNVTTNAFYYCSLRSTATPRASFGYISSTGEFMSDSSSNLGLSKCRIKPGGGPCDMTVSWSSTNAQTATFKKVNGNSNLSTAVSGSFKVEGLKPGQTEDYQLTLMPGWISYKISVGADCSTSDAVWNGSNCVTSAANPTAALNISPANPTITYPTRLSFTLTSTNALSCEVKNSEGHTYVNWYENTTSKTVEETPAPHNYQISAQCATGHNGAGVKSAVTTKQISVQCSNGTVWNGTSCGGSGTNTGSTGAVGTANPIVRLDISPTGTLLWPTNVIYSLSSENAEKCQVTSVDGSGVVETHINYNTNTTAQTVQGRTGVGTTNVTAICKNGTKVSDPITKSVTLVCPTGKVWNGSDCVAPNTSPSASLSIIEGFTNQGSWSGKFGRLSITATGAGLKKCVISVDGLEQYTPRVFNVGHTSIPGMGGANSIYVSESYIVNYPYQTPNGYIPMTQDEYNLLKGKRFRLVCEGESSETVRTDTF